MVEYYKIIAWSDCPFCIKAKDLLVKNNKQFMCCMVDESSDLLKMLKQKHNWETVPMIIHYKLCGPNLWESEFIGGYSDLCKIME